MLDNHGTTPVDRRRPFQATTHQLALVFDCSANRHIREMLRVYGLRTSLISISAQGACGAP